MNRSDDEAPPNQRRHRHCHQAPPNVQQDALRRLTSNRNAASFVPSASASAAAGSSEARGGAIAASMASLDEESDDGHVAEVRD
jgi:hypothetical protein